MSRRKLKVHLLDDAKTPPIPFTNPKYLRILNVDVVADIDEADLIAGHRRASFDSDSVPAGRLYLAWTHEPFFDTSRSVIIRKFLPERFDNADLYVFNVHNGQIYLDNFYYAPGASTLPRIRDLGDLNTSGSDRTVTLAATNKNHRMLIKDEDISLYGKRSELAMWFHKRQQIKIIGRHWPDNVSLEDTRYSDRHVTKDAFLKLSNFNLCYENCYSDYYVTEKIWDAISGGTLPIYYSNGTIYQNFPQDSFIDGRKFRSNEALGEFVTGLGEDSIIRRINRCRDVHNFAAASGFRTASRLRAVERLASFLDAF